MTRTYVGERLTFVGECLEWPGRRNFDGYGLVAMGRQHGDVRIARVVWEAVHGPIADDICVLHRCDNPPCYRLAHLFLGTRADNARDKAEKGRAHRLRGTANGKAKLEPDDVREIRRMLSEGYSMAVTAAAFGVHKSTVQSIKHGSNWSWLK